MYGFIFTAALFRHPTPIDTGAYDFFMNLLILFIYSVDGTDLFRGWP